MKKLDVKSKVKSQKANLFFTSHVAVITLCLCAFVVNIPAQSTEFTYQGRLLDSSLPPTANYDFEFSLWDSLVAGTQQGTTQTVTGVAVANGIFTVKLNFGANFPGAARFLEIHVRPAGGGSYITLAPRQTITSGPYSIRSLNSTTADTATNSLNLGGVAASQYVVTTDPRMTDDRNPLPGSTNYIQNGTTLQASSNFNISGNGVISGNLITNGNVGIGTSTPDGLQIGVPVSETARGVDNVRFGLNLGSPRAIFEDAGSTQWEMDNFSGRFRIFNPGAERFTIDSSGNVGIGTNNPGFKLVVSGTNVGPASCGPGLFIWGAPQPVSCTSALTVSTDGTGNLLQGVNNSSLNRVFVVTSSGNFGIGNNTNPDAKLTVDGVADKPGGGSWSVFSDERLKNIKGRFTPGLQAVMQLQPLRYEYKRDNALGITSEGEYVGFSAQEVEKIVPEAVTKNDKGYLLVNNDPILWTMLNAVKEQQAQIERLQKQIDSQQNLLLQQQRRIGALSGTHRPYSQGYPRRSTRTKVKRKSQLSLPEHTARRVER